jgi:NTP pyrophosphatase (non-canonical NTP hydrolase)
MRSNTVGISQYPVEVGKYAIYPGDKGVEYLILGLCSEAGEIAGKYKKVIRDQDGKVSKEAREAMADEVGDVLWYVTMLAMELGFTLDHIADRNASKLRSRHERGKLGGDGDAR